MNVAITVQLTALTCPSCGVLYALAEPYRAKREEDGRVWYCPNGHDVLYRETEADRARKAQQRAERALRYTEEALTAERAALQGERRQHAATKGKLTRERTRTANGVCPACHRHFAALERHMKGQHPGFIAAEEVPAS